MYLQLEQFLTAYAHEGATTARVLAAMTPAALELHKAPGDTSGAELAWHIATAPAWFIRHEGVNIDLSYFPPAGQDADAPPPDLTVEQLVAEYRRVHEACASGCREVLADADLTRTATWFGVTQPLGMHLNLLINHEVHHRGQLTAMLRGGGVPVPSLYGPNKEEYEEAVRRKHSNP